MARLSGVRAWGTGVLIAGQFLPGTMRRRAQSPFALNEFLRSAAYASRYARSPLCRASDAVAVASRDRGGPAGSTDPDTIRPRLVRAPSTPPRIAEPMADDLEEDYDAADDSFQEEGRKGGGGKKKLLLFILPVLLVVGGAAGAFFTGLLDPVMNMVTGGGDETHAAGDAHGGNGGGGHGGEGGDGAGVLGQTVFYDLPEMVVDLNAGGRKSHFLKVRVSLELASQADVATVEAVMPRVIDNFQVFLRELRIEDLQGAAGIYRVREELLRRVGNAVRPARVNAVLFKEMLVQ